MKIKHFNTKIFIRISLLITAFILIFSSIVLREFFNNYKNSLYNNFKNEFIARVNNMDVILEIVNGEAKYNIANISKALSDIEDGLSEEDIDTLESNIKNRLANTKYFDSIAYIYLGNSFDDWKGNWFVKTNDMQVKEEGPYDNEFIKMYFENTTEYDLIESSSVIDDVWNYVSEEQLDTDLLGKEFSTSIISNIHVLRDSAGNPKVYVTCDVSGRHFNEILKSINFNNYGEVQLLDENNDVLIKSGSKDFEGTIGKQLIIDTDSSEIAQKDELYYISKPLMNGWKVLFVANREDVFESYYKLVKFVLIFLFVFIFISFKISYILGKNISKPVNVLVRDVADFNLQEGCTSISPKYLKFDDEIGTLARALKKMQEQIVNDYNIIHNYNTNLELVVEEKTKDLVNANQELQEMLDHSINQKKELELLNLQLAESIDKVRIAQESLVESRKIAALSTLVTGVAHEINTPIGTCYTGITFLKKKVMDFEKKYNDKILTKIDFENFLNIIKETVDLIIVCSMDAIDLIDNFKKLSNSDIKLLHQKFNIKKLLRYLLEGLGLDLSTDVNVVCDEKLECESDPLIFTQIFNNLVINSIQHGYREGDNLRIDINIIEESDSLLITYCDYGSGMAKETLEKVFDPFFTTRRGNGNVGLGLNIVYNLVTSRLKGTIKIDSKLNEGTICEMKIPIKDVTEEQ